MDALKIEPGEPAQAAHLILAHDAFSAAQSLAESRHNLTLERMEGVCFWIARLDVTLVGCGATKPLDDGTEEIKSMHVAETARGGGIASALLSRIMADAAERGVRALRLETGSMDAFAAARRLYARHGFVECGPFGEYRADPHSAFMELTLSPPR